MIGSWKAQQDHPTPNRKIATGNRDLGTRIRTKRRARDILQTRGQPRVYVLKAFGLRDVDVIRREGITLDHAEKCLKAAKAVQHCGPGLLHKWLTGSHSPPALDVKSRVYDYVEAVQEHERDNRGYSAPFDQLDGTVGQFARVASHGESYRFRKRPPQARLSL